MILDFVIVGTGFSGLCMGVKAQQAKRSFVILEKADSVGGAWRENTYPGCACDVPSHLYSYSFAPSSEWSRFFAPQPEIRAYLERIAEPLAEHIRFHSEVTRATFDEVESVWHVETARGERYTGRYLVFGIGALHRPQLPNIKGLERFEGTTFHSAQWDHSYDLNGKRVAVIGSGASAIQFVPHLVERAASVTSFQRTPAWVLPKPDGALPPRLRNTFARVPFTQRLFRAGLYGIFETFTACFTQRPELVRLVERGVKKHLEDTVSDPVLRAKLTPNYRAGCKRILMSNDYYQALVRPNASVVTEAITHVSEHAVHTRDQQYDVDAIVFGTGFQVTELLTPLQVLGRDAVDLNAAWSRGLSAYLGTTITGFPNAFMLLGPNTGLSTNSMIFMIEAQVDYVMACVREARRRRARSLEVLEDAETRFNTRLQRRMDGSIWATGCKSWYLDEHGKNTTLWPGLTLEYWARTRQVNTDDYEWR